MFSIKGLEVNISFASFITTQSLLVNALSSVSVYSIALCWFVSDMTP